MSATVSSWDQHGGGRRRDEGGAGRGRGTAEGGPGGGVESIGEEGEAMEKKIDQEIQNRQAGSDQIKYNGRRIIRAAQNMETMMMEKEERNIFDLKMVKEVVVKMEVEEGRVGIDVDDDDEA